MDNALLVYWQDNTFPKCETEFDSPVVLRDSKRRRWLRESATLTTYLISSTEEHLSSKQGVVGSNPMSGTYGSFAGLNDLRKPARGLSSEQCRPNIPVAADQEKWYTLDLCLRGATYYWSRCCSGFNLLSVGSIS